MLLVSLVRLVSQLLSSLALLMLYKLLILNNQQIDEFINDKVGLAAAAALGPSFNVPHISPRSLAIAIPVAVAAYGYTYSFISGSSVLFVISLSSAVLLAVHSFACINTDGDLQYATFVYMLIVANLLRAYYFAFVKPTSCQPPSNTPNPSPNPSNNGHKREDDFRHEIRRQQEQQEEEAIAARVTKMKKR